MIAAIAMPQPNFTYRTIGRETFPAPQPLYATGANVGAADGYANVLDARSAAEKLTTGAHGAVALVEQQSKFFLQPVETNPNHAPGLIGAAVQKPYVLEGRVGREPVMIDLTDASVLSVIDGAVALSKSTRG